MPREIFYCNIWHAVEPFTIPATPPHPTPKGMEGQKRAEKQINKQILELDVLSFLKL